MAQQQQIGITPQQEQQVLSELQAANAPQMQQVNAQMDAENQAYFAQNDVGAAAEEAQATIAAGGSPGAQNAPLTDNPPPPIPPPQLQNFSADLSNIPLPSLPSLDGMGTQAGATDGLTLPEVVVSATRLPSSQSSAPSTPWSLVANYYGGMWNGLKSDVVGVKNGVEAAGSYFKGQVSAFENGGLGATTLGQLYNRSVQGYNDAVQGYNSTVNFASNEFTAISQGGIGSTETAQFLERGLSDTGDFLSYVGDQGVGGNLENALSFWGGKAEGAVQSVSNYFETHTGNQIAYSLGNFVGSQAPVAAATVLTDGAGALLEAGGEATDASAALTDAVTMSPKPTFDQIMENIRGMDFSTAPNTAVFYSGTGTQAFAEKFAADWGLSTISGTEGGAYLNSFGDLYSASSGLSRAEADQLWSYASQQYASGASGDAVAILSNPSPTRIYLSVERPILTAPGSSVNLKEINPFTWGP